MVQFFRLIWGACAAIVFGVLATAPAHAEQADVDAAARGVVRLVIIASDGERAAILGHGTGFAITSDTILTNAHVVEKAARFDDVGVGVIRAEGDDRWPARIVAYSPGNDLALVKLTREGSLPPLTIFTGAAETGAQVYTIGYPGAVDMARGLRSIDLIEPTRPVTSSGTLSGGSSAKAFDTVLHTATMGAGNSGGPLVDACGRVLGVNSFGSVASAVDAEFFFAVSVREVQRFLKESGVQAMTTGSPCRTLAELDRIDAENAARANEQERADAEKRAQDQREALDNARAAVMSEREDGMALAGLALVLSLASGAAAFVFAQKENKRGPMFAAAGLSVLLLIGAIAAWLGRPSLDEAADRARSGADAASGDDGTAGNAAPAPASGDLVCVIDNSKSRITVSPETDVPFNWSPQGCVNNRTQYGKGDEDWLRVLVPNVDQVVTVARFDPASATYRTERYLLDLDTMERMRERRRGIDAPSCSADNSTVAAFGQEQVRLAAMLPAQPNEKLVFNCHGKR